MAGNEEEAERILSTVDNTTLGDDDWNIACMQLQKLNAKWKNIGRALGIPAHTLEEIGGNHHYQASDCLSSVLKEWIGQNYNTATFGLPSWRTLCKAVLQVDFKSFKELAQKHGGKVQPPSIPPPQDKKETKLTERITNMRQLKMIQYTKNGEEKTINVVRVAAHRWRNIADLITEDLNVVDNLREEFRGKNEEAFSQLLKDHFISANPVFGGYTKDWNGLIKLLNDAQLGALASDVKEAITS